MPAVPVMFPPGRAMLSTIPISIASPLNRIATSGTVAVTCLAATLAPDVPTAISSTFRSTSSVARARYRWDVSLGPAGLHGEVAALDPAQLPHSIPEPVPTPARHVAEDPDQAHPLGGWGLGREQPAAGQQTEAGQGQAIPQ